jgi:hypothetical protein
MTNENNRNAYAGMNTEHLTAAFTPQGSGRSGLYFVMQVRPPCTALYAIAGHT